MISSSKRTLDRLMIQQALKLKNEDEQRE